MEEFEPKQEKKEEVDEDEPNADEQKQIMSYIEVYSLAQAWVLFETLIQKNLVRKHNRRAYLGTCILISFKQV
jgi:hypothetical protein